MCLRSGQAGSDQQVDEPPPHGREGDKRYRRKHLVILAVRVRDPDPRQEGQSTHRKYGDLVRSREPARVTRSYCKKPLRSHLGAVLGL